MRSVRVAVLLAVLVAVLVAGCARSASEPTEVITVPEPEPEPPEIKRLTIAVAGDIMMHMPQVTAGKKPDGTYDFRHFFEEVKPLFERADLAICNLETTLTENRAAYTGYPMFKSPVEILDALKYAGFEVVSLANNHAFDGFESGVMTTLDKLDEHGFLHTGRARSQQERDEPLLLKRNGITLAVLSYTYGTNGLDAAIDPEKRGYMVNLIDRDLIERDIRFAREKGAEAVIVCMHWGDEYVRHPNDNQRELADMVFSLGADVILGSHPHVLQPMERRILRDDTGAEREVFVIYSLGNFISNQTHDFIRHTDAGVILHLELLKDPEDNAVRIGEVSYTPTWVHRFSRDGVWDYTVLPLDEKPADMLSDFAKDRSVEVFKATTELMGDEFGTSRPDSPE